MKIYPILVLCVVLTTSNLPAELLDPMDYEPNDWPSGLDISRFTIYPDTPMMRIEQYDPAVTVEITGVWQGQENGPDIAIFCFDHVDCQAPEITIADSDHPVAILSQGDLIIRSLVDVGSCNGVNGKGDDGYRGVWISFNPFRGRLGPEYKAGGGGGGGFAGRGGEGGENSPLPVASGGGTYGDPASILQGGSEGGIGGKTTWWGYLGRSKRSGAGGKGWRCIRTGSRRKCRNP